VNEAVIGPAAKEAPIVSESNGFIDVTEALPAELAWDRFREWARAHGIDPESIDARELRIKHWTTRDAGPLLEISVPQDLEDRPAGRGEK
jgi:hypothetical protein